MILTSFTHLKSIAYIKLDVSIQKSNINDKSWWDVYLKLNDMNDANDNIDKHLSIIWLIFICLFLIGTQFHYVFH